MLMPPAVVAVLILFSRNHNLIAARILQIDEKGAYKAKDEEAVERLRSEDPEGLEAQDEDVFQLARNGPSSASLSALLRAQMS